MNILNRKKVETPEMLIAILSAITAIVTVSLTNFSLKKIN